MEKELEGKRVDNAETSGRKLVINSYFLQRQNDAFWDDIS